MTKFAVTAVRGKLGAAIAQASVENVGKENVIGLARTPSTAESLAVEVCPGDYESRRDLGKSLHGVDTLLLVSGMEWPTNASSSIAT